MRKALLINVSMLALSVNISWANSVISKYENKLKEIFTDKTIYEAALNNLKDVEKLALDQSDANYIELKRASLSSRMCLWFLLGKSNAKAGNSFISIVKDLENELGVDESKDFQRLMDRNVRKAVQKDIMDIPESERGSLCKNQIPKEQLVEREKKLEKESEDSYNNFLSNLHPKSREMAKKLREELEKQYGKKWESEYYKTLYMTIFPMLYSKATMETLPEINKKCPGVVEKVWEEECNGEKDYSGREELEVRKVLCIQDREQKYKNCF